MFDERLTMTGFSDDEKTHELPNGNIMKFQWPRFGCTGRGVAHEGSDCVKTFASYPGYNSSSKVAEARLRCLPSR